MLAGGGKATVRKVLDGEQACAVDVDGVARRLGDPDRLVLVKSLTAWS